LYEGHYLAHKGDVVVVTSNYRCEFCWLFFVETTVLFWAPETV